MKYSIDIKLTDQSRLPSVDWKNLPFGRTFSDHMFIADYCDGRWQNCRITPYGPIPMSPANMALHYGQSIFEGMKANKDEKTGEPILFRPKMHIDRINRSAQRMGMPQLPAEIFMTAIKHLVALDKDWIPEGKGSALYIRPIMYAADEFLGVRASKTYRFVVMTGPTGPYYPKPVKILVSEKYVRAFPGGVGFAKTAGNYAATIQPAALANEQGYDQILWLDGKEFKYLQECGTMNIFVIIGDTVITPPVADTVLSGITRDSLLHLLQDMGHKIAVRDISIEEVLEAHANGSLKEVFGSGTAAVVSHVKQIGYKGKNYDLPAIEDRKIGHKLKNHLEGIKSGIIEDKFAWVQKINGDILVRK